MDKVTEFTLVSVRLRVFYEEPFWIGVLERIADGRLAVCKITFGAEPGGFEINQFILENYFQLRFSPAVAAVVKEAKRNPKRVSREVHRQLEETGIGTKSQQALQLQREQMKTERKLISGERKEAEKQWQFELKQLKKKEKHRGR